MVPGTYFNPRAPYGARRRPKMPIAPPISNFNPRAPYGARLPPSPGTQPGTVFQSTRPIRGATFIGVGACVSGLLFQSTRPIRGATPPFAGIAPVMNISIHAPHTGRDHRTEIHPRRISGDFNPRAPYGARPNFADAISYPMDISIHAPHTGRDGAWAMDIVNRVLISIHAPHTGRDFGGLGTVALEAIFQSTRPIRGATRPKIPIAPPISNFNPRAPYGARP